MEPLPVRYLVVDDHTLFREGLASLLAGFADIALVAQASSGSEALDLVVRHAPQVVLMDLHLPDVSGAAATQEVLAAAPETAVCMLTMSEQTEDLYTAVRAGARGYLLKDSGVSVVRAAIKALAAGGTVLAPLLARQLIEEFARSKPLSVDKHVSLSALTPRERQVLQCVGLGRRNEEIAVQLDIAVNTVKVHQRNLLDKLGLRNRQHAAAFAAQAGLLEASQALAG